MKLTWLVDEYLLQRSTPVEGPSLVEAIKSIGNDVSVLNWNGKERRLEGDLPTPPDNAPVLAYGSFQFVRQALSHNWVKSPGAYFRLDELSFHRFAAHHGGLLLSDDFYILPFGELKRRKAPDYPIFIRPDRVTKSFTGYSFKPEEYENEMAFLDGPLNVSDDELIVVASAKKIELECRFVIADGEVVASSTYGWGEDFNYSPEVPEICLELANKIACAEWQPDTVYTCDVGITRDSARLIELNSFSCSGLYACDTVSVAKGVARAASIEFGMAKAQNY